jgi:hypothetical protein
MASRAPAEAAVAPAEASAAPTPSRHRESPQVRTALKVSSPGDAAEREAETTARRVMRMPAPARLGPILARPPVQAARAPAVSVPRPQAPPGAAAPPPKARRPEETSPELEAAIKKEKGGGRPLPADVVSFMAPRFKADFSGVRIHTGGKAENLSSRLGARAFTFGRDIFFNAGQFQPTTAEGMELIAHELTHTIQQREVVQREVQADAAPVEVRETSEPQVQRGIVSEALDWVADKANMIPGYRLLTIVIGRNPINMSTVSRSGANILRALIEFIPGGGLIVQALENHGIFEKGGKFIEEQFAALANLGGAIRDALMEFIDSLGWRDIFRLGSLWGRAKRIFTDPVEKAISFGKNLVSGIAEIVKDAIIKPLGRWAASNIPKWDLLVGVFGKNPISDEGASPAAALIGGFMELIGQKQIWENIQKGGAVARAWAWFRGAMSGALALVTSIPGRVMGVIRSLTIFDIVTIAGAFQKIFGAFASFVGDFGRWAGGTVLQLLEIILSVVAPSVVPYLKKAGGAFSRIIRNPVGFVRTLVRAGILGFRQFGRNFLTHLQASLVGWLTGSLGGTGIYIPQGFNLREIVKFVLSVLGLTWANIRAKLVRATGEPTVAALETGFDLVRTLVTQGPAAAWEKIVETLGNLKQMAIDSIMEFVRSRVVQAAITRLCSMITPAGAFIQAIIAIYNTIMFFVERIRQIAQVAASFIDSIATIASGNVAPAANRVEQTMAGLLTLVISFLARIAGLGRVSDAITGLIARIRAPIDRALDRVVQWIVTQARRLGQFVASGVRNAAAGRPRSPQEIQELTQRAQRELPGRIDGLLAGNPSKLRVRAQLLIWRRQYGLSALTLTEAGESARFVATINPTFALGGGVSVYISDAQLLGIVNEVAASVVRSSGTVVAARRQVQRDAAAAGGDSPTLEATQVRSVVGFASSQGNVERLRPPRVPTVRIGVDEAGNIISIRWRRFRNQSDPNRIVTGPTSGSPIPYSVFAASLGGNPAALLAALRAFATGAPVPGGGLNLQMVGEFYVTVVGQETARRPENLTFTIMMVDLIAAGTPVAGGIGMHPATRPRMGPGQTTGAAQRDLATAVAAGGPLRGDANMQDIRRRTVTLVTAWIRAELRAGRGPVTRSRQALLLWVRRAVRERMIRFIETGN